MVTVNTVSDGHGEQPWLFEQAPEEEFPIIYPVSAENPNDKNRANQCQTFFESDFSFHFYFWLKISQKSKQSLIIGFARIDIADDGMISI